MFNNKCLILMMMLFSFNSLASEEKWEPTSWKEKSGKSKINNVGDCHCGLENDERSHYDFDKKQVIKTEYLKYTCKLKVKYQEENNTIEAEVWKGWFYNDYRNKKIIGTSFENQLKIERIFSTPRFLRTDLNQEKPDTCHTIAGIATASLAGSKPLLSQDETNLALLAGLTFSGLPKQVFETTLVISRNLNEQENVRKECQHVKDFLSWQKENDELVETNKYLQSFL